MQNDQVFEGAQAGTHVLDIRLEEIGWALFLVMMGALWLFPDGSIPSQTWLLGAGLIMLGINFARYLAGIKMSGFTVFLGVVAIVAGLSGMVSVNLPIFPAVFIVLGISLFLRALFKKRD